MTPESQRLLDEVEVGDIIEITQFNYARVLRGKFMQIVRRVGGLCGPAKGPGYFIELSTGRIAYTHCIDTITLIKRRPWILRAITRLRRARTK